MTKRTTFTFIDLFAGIGGFHQAMIKLGGKCVFASELKEDLRELYKKNFGIECAGDINEIDITKDIPNGFNMLCAGFPCQPFSKTGKQQGFDDDGKDQDDDTIVPTITAQPIEHGNDTVVNPPD